MRRADRLFAIIQSLRGGRLRTADWLAERLGVSRRTIYRDIVDLQSHGAPIDGERGIGYMLRDGFFMPPLALSALEHEALQWGVALVKAHGDDALAAAAAELQAKVASASPLGATPTAFAAFASAPCRAHSARVTTIREALARREKLELHYRDAEGILSTRVVRPLELEHWGGVWTLTAWCETRWDFRVFRLDRIGSCAPNGERFRPERGKLIEDFRARLVAEHKTSRAAAN